MDTYARIFQFKLSHNALFLKARLFHLNYSSDSLCSLCENANETAVHLFCECTVTSNLWYGIIDFFRPSILLDPLTPLSALLGFYDLNDEMYLLKNHILLLFKYCIYKNRSETLILYSIISMIKYTYKIEKNIYDAVKFRKKWSIVSNLLE